MTKILAGITTGAMAVSFAQPTDVVKVRMQAQTNIDPTKPKRYTGAMHAYRTIARDEGMRGLWKGRYSSQVKSTFISYSSLRDITYTILPKVYPVFNISPNSSTSASLNPKPE